jgi:hypothetical protein
MKIVEPYSFLKSLRFYPMIIISLLIIIAPIPYVLHKILAVIICNAILYIAGVKENYSFEYDKERLVIKNAWNPFFYRGFWINRLKSIEFKHYPRIGPGISINFDSTEEIYHCKGDEENLKLMVEDINSSIKNYKTTK